jgi:hypothetical protein
VLTAREPTHTEEEERRHGSCHFSCHLGSVSLREYAASSLAISRRAHRWEASQGLESGHAPGF